MSALLRALMAQQATPSKPNLAITTENTVNFDALETRKVFPIGVTAKMGEFQNVHVSLDYEVTITGVGEAGGGGTFISGRRFVGRPAVWRESSVSVQTYSGHYESNIQSRYNSDNRTKDIFVIDVTSAKGICTIKNLVITEA